jgi:hypothetical protein
MPLLNDRNTIILKPVDSIGQYEEGRIATGATILPGMLIELTAAGTLQPHSAAGGAGECLIAIEDALIGGLSGQGTVNEARTAGQLIRYCKPKPGDEALVRIPPSAAAIVIGDDLVSNGDGKFKKTAGATNTVFGQCRQAYDNSANAASDAWIRIRFQGN